jgi:hypothetical protein
MVTYCSVTSDLEMAMKSKSQLQVLVQVLQQYYYIGHTSKCDIYIQYTTSILSAGALI